MTCRLEDSAYDYLVRVGVLAATPPLESGFERLDVAGEPEVRRLIERCARSGGSQGALRSLLKAEAPSEPVHRLSDPAVRDRVAALVARSPSAVWRRSRQLGTAGVGGALPSALDPDAPDLGAGAPTLAQAPAATPGPVRCGDAWSAINAETQAVLARGGDADPLTRNRHISAAYARLYQREPSLTWGGLAAVVSRQAGCAMAEAKEVADSRWGWAGGDDAAVAYRALADTNELIFEDVYPPMRFYEQHGMAGIDRCGDARPGGPVPRSLKDAMRQIDTGTPAGIRAGADRIARYEQIDIVQDQIYSDPEVVETFSDNQWWAKRPLGRMLGARKPEMPLSAECGGDTVPFRGDITVADDRVAYYGRLMDTFVRRGPDWQRRTMTQIARLGR